MAFHFQEGTGIVLHRSFAAVTPLSIGLSCLALLLAAVSGARAAEARYHTHAELSAWINRLAADHPRTCSAESIGTSREGRALWAMELAMSDPVEPQHRSAMLIVANIDGDHLIGSEVALSVAERLLAMVAEADESAVRFLTDHTLYIVPRVNPDAAERFFADVKTDRRRNVRPDDRDRDGQLDEDPPNDLNGDGLITMMRVYDPDEADMMPDPDEPRLDLKPDRDEGQRPLYKLYDEGIDDDGDGEFNEDGLGGVDLNMNFMHGYREHADGAGPHQVSEPESLALLHYVLAHQNIAVVLTYGPHDNLSKAPDGKGTDKAGAPKNLDPKDVGLYKHIGERYKEITGLKKVPTAPDDGAFFAWAYAQFGVPSFATPLWTRPEPPKEEKKEDKDKAKPDGGAETQPDSAAQDGAEAQAPHEGGNDEPDDVADGTPSGIGDISKETLDELRSAAETRGFEISDEMMDQMSPAQVERFAKRMGIKVRRAKGKKADGKAKNKEEAAWLKYSDEHRDGAGFIDWQKFEHPDLGEVEIGGWAPYFKTNPPAAEIPIIADKQVEFVLDLAGRFPNVSLGDAQITRLASGLYEVKVALVNEGYLPTGTTMAVRNRRARPYVVRLSVPNEQVITGRRINKIWSIPGSGGRESFRWIIQAPDDSPLAITVYSEKFGQFDTVINLTDNQTNAGNGGDS
ncbi:MAG: M14 family metallopeptidase [Planctomycetota bacterium]|nr:M14 family metallopeptidase [Planctomycetota bacterium]